MNKQIMDFDEMKQQLDSINRRLDNLEASNNCLIERMRQGKPPRTAREDLIVQYRTFAIIGPMMAVVFLMAPTLIWPLGMKVAGIAYFIITTSMDLYLMRGIKSIDLNSMGVAEVARKAILYRRRHHMFQIILIPMAIGVVMMMLNAADNTPMKIGMIIGAVIGLAVGVMVYRRIMRNYRSLTLNDCND